MRAEPIPEKVPYLARAMHPAARRLRPAGPLPAPRRRLGAGGRGQAAIARSLVGAWPDTSSCMRACASSLNARSHL